MKAGLEDFDGKSRDLKYSKILNFNSKTKTLDILSLRLSLRFYAVLILNWSTTYH